MDDLGTAISSFLEKPGAMEQLEAVAAQLGLGPSAAGKEPAGASPESGPEQTVETAALGLSPEKLAPLMAAFSAQGASSAETALLDALCPFLGTHSREKLDRAKRALGLMRAVRAVAGTISE